MNKHTLGPYVIFVDADAFTIMPAGRSGQIATILRTGANAAEADANARLLSAAPDLLEALEECASHSGGDIGDIDWEMVRAAILRAKETLDDH